MGRRLRRGRFSGGGPGVPPNTQCESAFWRSAIRQSTNWRIVVEFRVSGQLWDLGHCSTAAKSLLGAAA
eukprot:564195-Alexandrium_andersonii.AAC.1